MIGVSSPFNGYNLHNLYYQMNQIQIYIAIANKNSKIRQLISHTQLGTEYGDGAKQRTTGKPEELYLLSEVENKQLFCRNKVT